MTVPHDHHDETTLPHTPFSLSVQWHERDPISYAQTLFEAGEFATACQLLGLWREAYEGQRTGEELDKLRAATIRFLERAERGQSNTGASAPIQGQ